MPFLDAECLDVEPQAPFVKILIPLDGSDASINAGRVAIQIATKHQIPVIFLYVVDSGIVEEIVDTINKSPEAVHHELEEKGRRYLDYMARMAEARCLKTKKVIRHGIPHNEISELARELNVDLIVMGKVGRHVLRRALVGSVTGRVVEYAPCSVLVVKYNGSRH
ncbi:MAG: universal stress protein [Anaerolineae bacterium]|nr:universal stress protein [Anaerolineae bacterium]